MIFVFVVKTITIGEEFLVDYNLNRVDLRTSYFSTVQNQLYPNLKRDYLICECFIYNDILFYF
jgi:hypothetical protein